MRAALVLPGIREPNVARAHALYVGGVLATNQSDYAEAQTMLDRMPRDSPGPGEPARDRGDPVDAVQRFTLQQDDMAKAREYEEEAIGIFRELGDRVGEAIGLLNLGEISVRQGDHGSARELFEQCLAIARSIEHQELESDCERNLGETRARAGRPAGRASAVRAFAQGLPGRGRQAGRSDGSVAPGKDRYGRQAIIELRARGSPRRCGTASVRDERGSAGLPGRLCRATAAHRPSRRRGSRVCGAPPLSAKRASPRSTRREP